MSKERVRLTPEDLAPVKRGRGRPPGVRNTPRSIPDDQQRDEDLLTSKEQQAFLGVRSTRFWQLEKLPDFPPPVWIGARGKRRTRAALREWAMRQTTKPSK